MITVTVPLAEVLSCLVERVGLRLEYDGPAPQQMVTVALRGESLVGTIDSLFEGLGVPYMLGLDPSGGGVGQLIVFGASRVSAPAGPSPAGETQVVPVPGGEPEESPPLPEEPEELTPVTLQGTPRHGSRVAAMKTPPVW